MSKRNRNQQNRAKRLKRDQQHERNHGEPVKPVQVALTERVKNRFRSDEIQLLLDRTFEKFNEARRTSPRQQRMWLSMYRTLYGEVSILALETGLVAVTYSDEMPQDILAAFPTSGTKGFKFSDAEWAAYAKAMWQLTDGRTGGSFNDVPKNGGVVMMPHGEHQLEVIHPDGNRLIVDYDGPPAATECQP